MTHAPRRAHARLTLCFIALIGAAAAAQSPAAPPDLKSLARAIIDAPSDAARAQLLADNPALKGPDLVIAINDGLSGRQPAGGPPAFVAVMRFMRQLSQEIKFPKGAALALIGLGITEGRQGNYDAAMTFFEQARGEAEAASLPLVATQALVDMGIVHRRRGDYDLALSAFQQALAVYEAEGKDTAGMSDVLNNLGNVAVDQSDYRLSLGYYQRSLAIRQALKLEGWELASSYSNIGGLYERQGDLDLALDYYRRALEAYGDANEPERLAVILNNLGHVSVARRDLDQATAYLDRALALSRQTNNRWQEAILHENIGSVLVAQGKREAAIEEFALSVSQNEQLGYRLGMLEALNDLATAQLAIARPEAAAESAKRAASIAADIGALSGLWRSQALLGAALSALGDAAGAERAYRASLETIDRLRAQVAGGAAQRERAFESMQDPFHGLIDLLVRQQRADEALAVAERAKARVLLDEVLGDTPRVTKALSPAERERERELRRPVTLIGSELNSRLHARTKPDPARIADLVAKRDAALRALADFESTLYLAHPELRLRRGDAPALTKADLAALLPSPRSAVLEFEVLASRTVLLVVRPDAGRDGAPGPGVRVTAHDIRLTRSELEARTQAFRSRLAARDLDIKPLAREFYDALLGPAAAELADVTDLLVVPDGPLWQLPFQALGLPDGRWLMERAAVTLVPSLTVLRVMQQADARRAGAAPPAGLVALVLGSAGSAGGAAPASATAGLPPLVEAENQARAVGRIYGASRAKVLVGPDARPDRLAAEAASARVVHVAAHGVLNDASPMHSYLMLSRKPSDPVDAGRLEAIDLMNLDLGADVVVLSACESGRGRVGAGEGLVGMSWALFVAGAPSAVVSQWKVDSVSTTTLMTDFHRELASRMTREGALRGRSEALRQAAVKMLRGGTYAHPFYWAPFVVMGNGS